MDATELAEQQKLPAYLAIFGRPWALAKEPHDFEGEFERPETKILRFHGS